MTHGEEKFTEKNFEKKKTAWGKNTESLKTIFRHLLLMNESLFAPF